MSKDLPANRQPSMMLLNQGLPDNEEWGMIQEVATGLEGAAGFLPDHIQNRGQVIAVLLSARELGIPPMVAMRELHLVKGKVQFSAGLMRALAERDGVSTVWVETTDEVATLRLQRDGHAPLDVSFTMAMAKKAGLVKDKSAWKTHPAAMLRARAISTGVRAYAPWVVLGVYTEGEMAEFRPGPEVSRRQAPVDPGNVVDAVVEDEPEDAAELGDRLVEVVTDLGRTLDQFEAFHDEKFNRPLIGRSAVGVRKFIAALEADTNGFRTEFLAWCHAHPAKPADEAEPEADADADDAKKLELGDDADFIGGSLANEMIVVETALATGKISKAHAAMFQAEGVFSEDPEEDAKVQAVVYAIAAQMGAG